jgi:protein associated with RNAse G/E
MPEPVTVIKTNHNGQEVWRYEGVILKRGADYVLLEARFNRDDMDLGYVTFQRGDRFVETFYTDRWYNVFEIHAVGDDSFKGWYCNFTRPAMIADGIVQADDLALDLFVYPGGRMLVLDEDEFEALSIPQAEREAVLAALAELQTRAARGQPPFNQPTP